MKNKILIKIFLLVFIIPFYANADITETKKEPSRLESLAKLSGVIQLVEQYYVDDMKFDQIINKSIKGLMQELDAHSTYMDAKYFKEMKIQTKGEFGGLGIVVGLRDGALTVISPIDDTPAKKAGIESGDIILKIDDKSTLDITLDEAVKHMRGKPKTDIVITIVRKGETKPLKIKITRDIIKIKSVYAKTLNDNILFLRVASFDSKVTKDLKKYIKEHKEKTKGIILDLRNNPGGLLNQAIDATDLFINEGTIVSQKGRDVQSEDKFTAKENTTVTEVPMVVLVNGGSASASEIVAGALQDSKRAIVIGEKTFGKGSVQVVLPITIDNKEGIKLTIAKYYLPSGRTIQAVGITPDIESFSGKTISKKESDFSIKEADLKKHLKGELDKANGTKKSKIDKKEDDKDKKIITQKDLNDDNQLQTASNILKALILTNK
jgi:carboxyl-terminal processing protease